MKLPANKPCPCFSGRKAKGCCLPLLKGAGAETPEALMRSRYAAYSVGAAQYIIDTTHPDGPHWKAHSSAWINEIRAFCEATRFDGLQIIEAGDDQVLFRARLSRAGEDCSFVERSTFRRHSGQWCYLSGRPEPSS
jgi:SEC-C motif-containing protein